MWRRFLIVFALLLVLSNVFGLITVYAPVAKHVANGDTIALGTVAPGHVVTIITDRGPKSDPWTHVRARPSWVSGVTVGNDRLWIRVKIPPDVSTGTKTICLTLEGNASEASFCAAFVVTPNTLDANAAKNVTHGVAGALVNLPVLVVNKSVGETNARIYCENLSEEYCTPVTIHLGPADVKLTNISIVYPVPGALDVHLAVQDTGSLSTQRFVAHVDLQPNMRNDFRMALFGFPALDPILAPIRFLLVMLP